MSKNTGHTPANRDLIYGLNAVGELASRAPQEVLALFVSRDRLAERDRRLATIVNTLEAQGVKVQLCDEKTLERKSGSGVHQGIIAEIRARAPLTEADLFNALQGTEHPQLWLVLDGVTDPRNLGACMRSALAFGAQGLVVPRDRAASLTPAARKASSGASERLPLYEVTNLARVLEAMSETGITILGFDAAGEKELTACDLKGDLALVMGSEEKGLRRLTTEKCTALTRIPMGAGVESLNVSVAAAVALFETMRQRNI